ncbi:MAG: FAD-binding oxidoreductase, partial [Candidatus Peregrinibacteria bacterium]|nr:FAD-binding oxidoreductase [Candidatus Peregrinibacteria bacterium]
MALPPTYKTRLKEKVILTEHVRDFIFELIEPDTIEFQAGQFLLIKVNHPETGELVSRAYSICSPPQQIHDLVFNIEIVEGGKMTSLIESWEIGKEVEMQGPFGHFVMKSGPEKDLVFVGTGTGIAPLRSMVEDLLAKGDTRKMSMYFGVRHQDYVFYQDVFEKLAADHDNFDFTLTLSRPLDGWEGSTGRVTGILPAIEFDAAKTDVYMCGGKPMIDEVKQIFL